MIKDDIHELAMSQLQLAQGGNKFAEEQLIILIRDKYMKRRIGRYLHRNRQCEDEDLMQEFLIGVAFSIPNADMNIGDPIEYIINAGVYRVRTYLRKSIIQGTTQVCMDCGYETRLNRVGNHYECKRCGSHNITTREINDHDDTVWAELEATENEIEDIMTEMLMKKFEDTLDTNTNIYSLYNILKSGVNRDNPLINNYIREISIIWGGCSQQNVVQGIRKLQARLIKFAEDNNMQIKDNRFIQITKEGK